MRGFATHFSFLLQGGFIAERKNAIFMNYTMRKASLADRENIFDLKCSSIRPYVEEIWGWDEAYQEADFDSDFLKCGEFEVIEVERQFCGFIQLLELDNKIEICEIHLRPEFRGKGIGSSVLRRMISNTEGKTVSLGCFKKNEKAKKLYMRLGFVPVQETETHCLFEFRG